MAFPWGTGNGKKGDPINTAIRTRMSRAWTAGFVLLLGALLPAGELQAADPGPIQTTPGGRYFQFQDGTPFFPVGVLGMSALDIGPPKGPNRLQREAYFKLLSDSGANVLRLMVDGRTGGLKADPENWVEQHDLEDPVPDCGDEFAGGCDLDGCHPKYNPALEETLNALFGLSAKYGVYLQINPLVPGMIYLINGMTYPYLEGQGGPIPDEKPVRGLYVNGEALCLEKRRYKWLADTWGSSPHLFSWELMNEMPSFIYQPNALEIITDWISIMGNYVRSIDPGRLLTTSATVPCATADCPYSVGIFEHHTRNLRMWNHQEYAPGDPPLDIITYHAYNWPGFWIDGTDEIDTIQYQILHHLALVDEVLPALAPPSRPILNNEEMGMNLITGTVRHGGTMGGDLRLFECLHR